MMKIIRSVNHVAQWLAVRLYTRGSSRADRQRGISSLEYLVLAAVIIAVLVIAGTALQDPITNAFNNLASDITGTDGG